METINLCKLYKILNSVIHRRDYRSARAFLECKIFSERNDKMVNCAYTGDKKSKTWTNLTDTNVISELTRAKLGRHLCATKLTYAVTKLIIYRYNGILDDIEKDIADDLAGLNEKDLDFIVAELNALQSKGELPLLNDLKISRDNLAQSIVACALHCFYIKEDDIRKLGNAYSKWTITALNKNGISQEEFEQDFPEYVFPVNWDELAAKEDCNYAHCERCKHKCAQLRSNYNVEQLLKLYLNTNIKTEQNETTLEAIDKSGNNDKSALAEETVLQGENAEIVSQEDLSVLNAMIDTLGAEGLSIMLKAVINTKMSTGEKMQMAFDLMMKEKEKNGDNKK